MFSEQFSFRLVGDEEGAVVATVDELGTTEQSAPMTRVTLFPGELDGLNFLQDEAMELLEEVEMTGCVSAREAPTENDTNRHSSTNELEAYVLGQISEAEINLLELHLFICVECTKKLAKAESGVAFLKSALRL